MTGGTGYIGKGVASTLRKQRHRVSMLTRNASSAREARALGAEAVQGDLRDPDTFLGRTRSADAVIHLANTGDSDADQVDQEATRAMVEALEGSGKPFIYTSGVWVLGSSAEGELDEESPVSPAPFVAWREPLEKWLVEKAGADVRTVVIRPGIVFGGDGGIPGMMARGELPLVGDGSQRWPIVHLDDLAKLYLKALDAAPSASILHGITSVVPARTMARVASDSEIPSVSLEEARSSMGPFADALALDQNISSRKTQRELKWHPEITLSTWDRMKGGW
jgi:nucleoside-diphosphate-sugar epimerase